MSEIVLPTVSIENKENIHSLDSVQTRDSPSILKSMNSPIFILGIVFMFTVGATEMFVGNFLAVYWKENYGINSDVAGTILMICGVFYSLITFIIYIDRQRFVESSYYFLWQCSYSGWNLVGRPNAIWICLA